MRFSEKTQSILVKIEILAAVVLFFVMLISCGFYIDIKLNGKISNLPSLSENDKKILMISSVSESVNYSDDLLEPVFVGFKQDEVMKAVLPVDDVRKSVEENVYETLGLLFGGEKKKIEFESVNENLNYIERKKYSRTYMLVEFFDDLPSSVVLPCILSDYKGTLRDKSFVFKYLFILPDENGNVYGCAVSKNLEVCELFPKSVIRFDKILNESYDISEGFTDFEYSDTSLLYPVLASSVTVEDKRLESYAAGFGKDSDLAWIDNLFDVFSFNTNLVRSFISGDGTEINYVQESCELIVDDSGTVEFKTSDDVGILLNEFLGSAFEIGGDLTFSDKIFSLKNIINRIAGKGSGMSFSLVGLNYDSDAETLKVYFKYTADGVFVFNSNFDAVFEIRNNELVYAKFIAAKCIGTETFTTVMPQKYASLSNNDTAGTPRVFLAMNMQDDGIRTVCWVNSSVSSEVNE